MRQGEAVFVDSGRGLPLPCHAIHYMSRRESNGSRCTEQARSFTPPFRLSSRHSRSLIAMLTERVALTWKEAIYRPGTIKLLPCELRDLEQSWDYFPTRRSAPSCRRSMPPALQS